MSDKYCEFKVLKSIFKLIGVILSLSTNNPVGTLISFESMSECTKVVDLQRMIGERFTNPNWFQYPYVFTNETKEKFVEDNATFKQMVAKEELTLEQKGKDPITVKPFGKIIGLGEQPFRMKIDGGADQRIINHYFREEKIEEHKMHREDFFISKEVAAFINEAKKCGRPIIACGTTSARTLEAAWNKKTGMLESGEKSTDIFIYPPYHFNVVDGLITNFHTPESTLLMLVSAFCSREKILCAYQHAIEKSYKFFSYGDAMLIL